MLCCLNKLNVIYISGVKQKKALETESQLLKEKLVPTESAVVEAANKFKSLQVNYNIILNIINIVKLRWTPTS